MEAVPFIVFCLILLEENEISITHTLNTKCKSGREIWLFSIGLKLIHFLNRNYTQANYWTYCRSKSSIRVNTSSCKEKQDTGNFKCGDRIKEAIRVLINSADHIVTQRVFLLYFGLYRK